MDFLGGLTGQPARPAQDNTVETVESLQAQLAKSRGDLRNLADNNSAALQKAAAREGVLRGALSNEVAAPVSDWFSSFSWDNVGKPETKPRTAEDKKVSKETPLTAEQIQQMIQHGVQQGVAQFATQAINQVQTQQTTQLQLQQKFAAEHPDLAEDERACDNLKRLWSKASKLNPGVPMEQLYNEIVPEVRLTHDQYNPPAPKPYGQQQQEQRPNNPYPPMSQNGSPGPQRYQVQQQDRSPFQLVPDPRQMEIDQKHDIAERKARQKQVFGVGG